MSIHSTGIRIALDHCPRALDHHERGTERYDRRGFETGIACHAVLEAVGRETEARGHELETADIEAIANGVADALIIEGREFDGRPEPPLHPDAVFAGRELAEEWLGVHPLQPVGARYEVGLAVNLDWEPVPYDSPDAWIACIVDVSGAQDAATEEGETRILTIRDYKTPWSASAAELQTLQRKIQAVMVSKCLPEAAEADVLVLEVAAVRTWRIFSEEVYLRHGGLQKLRRWQRDIGTVVNELGAMAMVNDGIRPARPGPGCVGCPFLWKCNDAQLYFNATGLPDDPKERARAYSIASAILTSLKPMVERDAGYMYVALEDGGRVGWQSTESSQVKEDAHRNLAQLWCEKAGRPEIAPLVSSLLAAMGGLSLTAIRKALKVLYPTKEDREHRMAEEYVMTEPVKRRQWSIWKEEQ